MDKTVLLGILIDSCFFFKTSWISFIDHIQNVFQSSKTQYHKAAYTENVGIKKDCIPEKESSLQETSVFVDTILYLAQY